MGEYIVKRSNIKEDAEGILCTYVITDSKGNSEVFNGIYHEKDDLDAFLVFSETNEEIYINRGENRFN